MAHPVYEPYRAGTHRPAYALKRRMPRIRVYTTRWCGYCVRAKTLLASRGIPYEEISLDDDPAFRQTVFDATGGWTVPQILVDGKPIGGYTELWRLDRDGRLDELLAA
jgi:glutaredoxin 3